MNSALARFQDDFARALRDPDDASGLAAQPGFAVYRNTVMKGCVDALQANYPAVARLVGEEWFRAAAAAYARDCPPRLPMLLEYGDGFEAFLRGFAPAAELPYLPDVARLDRCWTESHAAADAAPLAGLDAARIADARLRPHPAARWAWFPDSPAYTIWSRNRADGIDDADLDWRAEGALLTRANGAVTWAALSRGGCALLDACAAGATLADAAEAALRADADADLAALMRLLLAAGAFAAPETMEE